MENIPLTEQQVYGQCEHCKEFFTHGDQFIELVAKFCDLDTYHKQPAIPCLFQTGFRGLRFHRLCLAKLMPSIDF
jgi:hypothetical protein